MAAAAVATTVTKFPPPEVLEVIFSNLEKPDLLNSRLVSQDWNQNCLDFFKKSSNSKFRITLDHTNSEDYITFVSSQQPKLKLDDSRPQRQPVMPIHLKLKILRYDDSDTYEEEIFEEFLWTVTELQDLFGPDDCVRDLTFIYPDPSEIDDEFIEKIQKVLSDLSPALEKLEIRTLYEFPLDSDSEEDEEEEEKEEEEEQRQPLLSLDLEEEEELKWIDKILFPKVKHLTLELTSSSWKLIYACPKLETLIVSKVYDEDITEDWESVIFPPEGVKSCDFEKLNLPTYWLLGKMWEHPSLPALEKLKGNFALIGMNDISDPFDAEGILRLFAPTLRSLTIPLSLQRKKTPVYNHNVPFPVFPALKSLTFSANELSSSFPDPGSFPALESVNIPFDTKLNQDADATQFPNVKILTLRLRFGRQGQFPGVDKFEDYQRIFPNISTIAFVNNNEKYDSDGIMIKMYLRKFFQLPGDAGMSKIQVLELIDFDQNYLGQVLQQFQHPPRLILENMSRNPLLDDDELFNTYGKLARCSVSEVKIREEEVTGRDRDDRRQTIVELEQDRSSFENCLKNLRKIRLIITPEARHNRNLIRECKNLSASTSTTSSSEEFGFSEFKRAATYSTSQIQLYLNEMMTSFPNLEEIEVSSIMFAHNGATGRAERIQRIKKKFPALRINII